MKAFCFSLVGLVAATGTWRRPSRMLGFPCHPRPRSHAYEQKRDVDNVHTFRPGLARTRAGLARIPHVSATSQQYQGPESRSSPTSGTVLSQVRGFSAPDCAQNP